MQLIKYLFSVVIVDNCQLTIIIQLSKHKNKHIQSVIEYALSKGWRIVETGKSSHAFCRLYCSEESRYGCKISFWSTPANPENHASQIKRQVDKCNHK